MRHILKFFEMNNKMIKQTLNVFCNISLLRLKTFTVNMVDKCPLAVMFSLSQLTNQSGFLTWGVRAGD